jgi:HlyD family secretion protein
MAAIDAARSGVAVAEVELTRARTSRALCPGQPGTRQKLAKTNIVSKARSSGWSENLSLPTPRSLRRSDDCAQAAELASAQARLAQPGQTPIEAANGQCCVDIISPIDGIILSLNAKSEQAASVGQLIAEVGDPPIWRSRWMCCRRTR